MNGFSRVIVVTLSKQPIHFVLFIHIMLKACASVYARTTMLELSFCRFECVPFALGNASIIIIMREGNHYFEYTLPFDSVAREREREFSSFDFYIVHDLATSYSPTHSLQTTLSKFLNGSKLNSWISLVCVCFCVLFANE